MRFRNLPSWQQNTIAALIMAVIAAAGYFVGRDQPVPRWIEDFLIPALGVLGLIGIVLIVVDWLRQRLRQR